MISCISPNSGSCEHTLNTLRYADRVKSLSKGSSSRKDLLSSTSNLRNSIQLPVCSSSSSMLTRTEDVKLEKSRFETNRFGWPKQTDRESSPSFTAENVPVGRPTVYVPLQENYRSDYRDEVIMEDDFDNSIEETHESKNILIPEKPNIQMKPVVETNNDLNGLLEEEESLVLAHRKQVEETIDIGREEMNLLVEVDQPGNQLHEYITKLNLVLSRKAAGIQKLQIHLRNFQKQLEEYNVLSSASSCK